MRALRVFRLVAAAAFSLVAAGPLHAQAAGDAPPHVRAADTARVHRGSPADESHRWLLAFVDIETTGLVPGWHEPVDMGVVITDLDGLVVDSLFVRILPRHEDRVAEGARGVNGYDRARWLRSGALEPAAAVDSIVSFHRRVAGDRPTMMVAFNSQFDTAFLDHLFRGADASWRAIYHYFVLDVPSMAWAMGYRDLTNGALARRLGVADEPRTATEHTGITGAMLNVRIYRALRERGMEPLP